MFFFRKLFKTKGLLTTFLLWIILSSFYSYQYMLRMVPALIKDELKTTLLATPEKISTLNTIYFISYTLFQIPMGVLIDKYGIKKITIASIILCLIGCIIPTIFNKFYYLQISRFLIGASSASALICILKIIAELFPPGSRGFLIGANFALNSFMVILYSKFLDSIDVLDQISISIGALLLLIVIFFFKEQKINTIILY